MAAMGEAAVPINMLILGSSLASFNWQTLKEAPWCTNLSVVFAKVNQQRAHMHTVEWIVLCRWS